jgi:hypothetical protein
MADIVTSTLSNAPRPSIASGTGQVASAQFGRPNPPHQQIKSQISEANRPPLQYPADRPKYYMLFDVFDYQRAGLQSVGKLEKTVDGGFVILPLPQSLNDIHQVKWNDHINLFQEVLGAIPMSSAVKKIASPLLTVGQNLLGVAPNQWMTILMEGPLYKRFSFTWSFSPREFRESDDLRKIIRSFNNWMAPSVKGGGFVWGFPKIFWVSILPNSKFMMKFKPAVLESFMVIPTPKGASFYHNEGATAENGDNPPEGISMEMKFLELEYWTEGDYKDNNDPHDVYKETPSAALKDINVEAEVSKFTANALENLSKFQESLETAPPQNSQTE